MLSNLLDGPILAGAPEGDAVPCEVRGIEAVPMRTLPQKERGVRQQQRGLSRLRE